MKMNKKGFTLIEMLVVIAIIAILVAIIVPVVNNSTVKARAAADAANLRSIAAEVAIDLLDNDTVNGTYTFSPKSSGVTGTLTVYNNKGNIEAWYGSYGVAQFSNAAEDGSLEAGTAPSGTGVSSVYTPG